MPRNNDSLKAVTVEALSKWTLVYDDGRTPAIHTKEVEAETMAGALAASGLSQRDVWACALSDHIEAAAVSLSFGQRGRRGKSDG
jgi:hypothetical protein